MNRIPGQELINVNEVVRVFEHDKECFTEMMYKDPYNNKAILVELVRRLIIENSIKSQMIEDLKKTLHSMEENIVETERILNKIISGRQSQSWQY